MKNDIDPQKPFVAEDGYEYEDLADYLIGKKAEGRRNYYVAKWKENNWPAHAGERIWHVYTSYNRDGAPYVAPGPASEYLCAQLPGLARFKPEVRHAEGAGQSGAVQAPADPVHAAD